MEALFIRSGKVVSKIDVSDAKGISRSKNALIKSGVVDDVIIMDNEEMIERADKIGLNEKDLDDLQMYILMQGVKCKLEQGTSLNHILLMYKALNAEIKDKIREEVMYK